MRVEFKLRLKVEQFTREADRKALKTEAYTEVEKQSSAYNFIILQTNCRKVRE